MPLVDKLQRLKHIEDTTEDAWETYKKEWVKAVDELEHTIMYKWFEEYAEKKLMEFNLVQSKRFDGYLGEYMTTSLEIALANNNFFMLEPISGVTTEYYGKLEFYKLGTYDKKVTILRDLLEDNRPEWILATSHKKEDHRKLTKNELESFIDLWLF